MSDEPSYAEGGAKAGKTVSEPRHVGWDLLLGMATLAFVFVILAGIGRAWIAGAVSLSLPPSVIGLVQILGYGLQIFAAIWFIVLAVMMWLRFTRADTRTT